MKVFIFCLSLICSSLVYGQIAVIKGTIKDERTKKPIFDVRVSLENDPGTNTYTDSMGKFEISIAYPEGESIFFYQRGL